MYSESDWIHLLRSLRVQVSGPAMCPTHNRLLRGGKDLPCSSTWYLSGVCMEVIASSRARLLAGCVTDKMMLVLTANVKVSTPLSAKGDPGYCQE